LDEVSLPGRSGLHALVPEDGQLVPRGADVVVRAAFLAHVAERSVPSVPVSEACVGVDPSETGHVAFTMVDTESQV
jgi:hypothetical protein